MNEQFSDELISAFLDGELTGEEQSRVEELLMDSAEHRRMFKELRALRDSLQALPSFALADDFSQRVLRRAERTMLSQPSTTATSSSVPGKDFGDPVALARRQHSPTKQTALRSVAWVCAAIAAVLLIALFATVPNYQNHGDPRVAGVNDREDREADRNSVSDRGKMKDRIADGEGGHGARGLGNPEASPPAGLGGAPVNNEEKGNAALNQLAIPPANAGDSTVTAPSGPAAPSADGGPGSVFLAPDQRNQSLYMSSDTLARTGDASELFVVRVDVPEAAYQEHVIDLALAQNGIQEQRIGYTESMKRDVPGVELAAKTEPRRHLEKELQESSQDRLAMLDVLVVNATPAQIDATFKALQSHGFAMTVDPDSRIANQPRAAGAQDLNRTDGGKAGIQDEVQKADGLPVDSSEADAAAAPDGKNQRGANRDGGFAGPGGASPAESRSAGPSPGGVGLAKPASARGARADKKAIPPDEPTQDVDPDAEHHKARTAKLINQDELNGGARSENDDRSAVLRDRVREVPAFFYRVPAPFEIEKLTERRKLDPENNAETDKPEPTTDAVAPAPQRARVESALADRFRLGNETLNESLPQTIRVVFVIRGVTAVGGDAATETETKPSTEKNR